MLENQSEYHHERTYDAGERRAKIRRSPSLISSKTLQPSHVTLGFWTASLWILLPDIFELELQNYLWSSYSAPMTYMGINPSSCLGFSPFESSGIRYNNVALVSNIVFSTSQKSFFYFLFFIYYLLYIYYYIEGRLKITYNYREMKLKQCKHKTIFYLTKCLVMWI